MSLFKRIKRIGVGKSLVKIKEVNDITLKNGSSRVTLKLEREKVLTWLANGATPSDTVRAILSKEGILKEFAEKKASK